MTKSEKNALGDVITMLNAIVNGNDEDDKTNHQAASNKHQPTSSEEENPSDKEIEFIRKVANDEPFNIVGYAVILGKGVVGNITIGKNCLGRMITAYLEKYCHE